MNRKLDCLMLLTEHAIGRENAVDSVTVAEMSTFNVNEASSYLHILWQEHSVERFEARTRTTAHGRRRTTYRYYIKKSANVESVLRASEAISERGRFRAKPSGFDTSALVACW